MRIPVLTALLLCALFSFTGAALAATDGTRGETSGGNAAINAQVPSLVLISSLDDVDLGVWDGQSAMAGADPNCVWSTTGGYNITGIGSGTNGAFTITNGNDELTYTATWEDSSNKKAKKLKVNKALTGRLTDADTQDCNGTTNATIAIDINKGRLNSANAGLYTGTLTLIVAVE